MEPQNEGADQSTSTETPAVDLSALQAALTTEIDKRLSGFQSILDRRTSEISRELTQLKTADLTPEEREQLAVSEAQSKLEKLERENEMLRMRKQFGEEVDFLDEFMKQPSLQDQLNLLSQFRKAQVEAEAQGEETSVQPTPVDKNNPSRRQELSIADMAQDMTAELADKVLQASSEKGLLRRLRGG